MAINPRDESVFDGKIDETDLANYPYGKPQNITDPGDGTGTPWEQLGIRDIWGFQQALLTAANLTPNGNSETAQSSQYLNAIRGIIRDETPVGAPMMWPLSSPPNGFLECRGQSFNTTTFPQLAVTYPSGVLPDLRGEFIRGWDNGRGIDTGRSLLSAQAQAIQNHTHGLTTFGQLAQVAGGSIGNIWDGTSGGSTGSTGGAETRPRNIAFMFIVRAT